MSESEFQNQTEETLDDERLGLSFLEELRSFMESEEVEELQIETSEGFQIMNREQAGFFLRKVEEIRAQVAAIKAEAVSERNRITSQIDRWEQAELNKCQNAEDHLVGLLRTFAEKELEGKTVKTVNLPYGKLSFVKQSDKFEYDDAKLLEHLEKNGLEEFIQRKPSPKKADLKKKGVVKNGKLIVNGVPVAGVTVTPAGPDNFSVKTDV